jgi:DNA topoisomerase-2
LNTITIDHLFNNDVRSFSVYANQRSIPHILDGLKPSQRKALYVLIKRSSSIPETGIKVSQLAAAVAEQSHYHHGEASLEATIVGLAQDYTGSNNLNYFVPLGQFGNRLSPTASAGRYIYTKPSPVLRKMFMPDDDLILEHLDEDGDIIEPKFYLPILPNILINGSEGMGTGFATKILTYNPNDLKDAVLAILTKQNVKRLIPWFKGFTGKVEALSEKQYQIFGSFKREGATTIHVTELPVGVYLDQYKEHLNKLIESGFIKDYDSYSTDTKFHFKLTCPKSALQESDDSLMSKLKLISKVSENLTVWITDNDTNKIKAFKDANELLEYFVSVRLPYYEKRRLALITQLNHDLEILEEKSKFIEYYLENSIAISKMKKTELYKTLESNGFKNIEVLLSIKIYNLTLEAIETLNKSIKKTLKEIKSLESTNATKMYIDDLTNFSI